MINPPEIDSPTGYVNSQTKSMLIVNIGRTEKARKLHKITTKINASSSSTSHRIVIKTWATKPIMLSIRKGFRYFFMLSIITEITIDPTIPNTLDTPPIIEV